MKPHFGEVCGVEYNDGMLEKAVARFGAEVPLAQGSAQNIPHPEDWFDVVTINQVIHHFDTKDDFAALSVAIQECYRVLKPGGCLMINTSTPEQQRDGFWWLSLFPEASARICQRFPPLNTLISKMTAAGFKVDADGVVVPLRRPLMKPELYLQGGIDLAFDPTYRACDSSWEMIDEVEMEHGLEKISQMKEDGEAEGWLADREALRFSCGQFTFVVAKKPQLGEPARTVRKIDSDYQLADSP
eukprot:TRINITY_DN60664_c0_g1_i1.p2 TRINITY_DN60664_c0_g1~~TRINITY_DN60664_c0_g1_i1.p2  ORF type:complete len:243 (-),score=62.77 TRINITY_DN60664_c0_g1_i1:300-1028(-)